MKLRFISVLLAVLLLVCCVAPAEVAAYRDVSYDEWCNMSIEQQYEYIADLVAETGGRVCDYTVAASTFLVHSSSSWLYHLVTGGALNPSDNFKYLLEWWGIADYGLGVYGVDDWSEDTSQYIDDKYSEYMEQYPYAGILQFDANGQALLDNGCYIQLVVTNQYTHTSINDKYQTFFSVVLYDASGAKIKKLDMYDKITLEGGNCNEYSCYSTLGTCDGVLGFELMDGTTGTYAIRFKVYDTSVSDFVIKIKYFGLTSALLGDDADNATPINPDDTAIEPDKVSDDYMDDFWKWLKDILLEQYGRPIEFDDSNITASLDSIYSKLHAILTSMENRFDKVMGKLDSIISKLDSVITAIENIDMTSSEASLSDDEEQRTEQKSFFERLIDTIKAKVNYDVLIDNINKISDAFFGKRVFETTKDGEIVATMVKADGTTVETVVSPHLYITIFDKKYDLFASVGVAFANNALGPFKSLVSIMLYVGFFLGLFRSLPDIVMNCGRVMGIPSYVESTTEMIDDNGVLHSRTTRTTRR